MSLARMIFLSTLLAGWAALFGWLICEFSILRGGSGRWWEAVAVAACVGAAIGAGVGAAAGLGEGMRWQAAIRAAFGLIGGFVGGAIGGGAGQLLYSAGLPRAVGWALMGLGIGATDGLIQRSARKTRNGLLGGAIGGLIGGLLFGPIGSVLTTGTGMASRATGFVIMGLVIGAMIGVVQFVLREAWVTVVDGFRTGRQLILNRPVTVMGRAEHVPLPFLGNFGKALEMEHAKIIRQPNGRFLLVDNETKTGTRVNNQDVRGSVVLNDGDVIRIGSNYVRFNEQVRRKTTESTGAKPALLIPKPPMALAPEFLDDDVLPFPAAPNRAPVSAPVAKPPAVATPAPMPVPVAKPPTSPPRSAEKPTPLSPSVVVPKPPAASPPRPPAPAPPIPKATTPPKAPGDPDACPYCLNGAKHPGRPGQRYCMIHDQVY